MANDDSTTADPTEPAPPGDVRPSDAAAPSDPPSPSPSASPSASAATPAADPIVGRFKDSPEIEASAAAAAAKGRPGSRRPSRRRKWLKIAGAALILLVVGLLLLVALTPKIASTGVVRSMVVNQINKNLSGKVEIADWSISWTGGLRVTGIKVFDDQSRQVAQVDSLTTQLKLTDAIRGNLAFGTSTLVRPDATYTEYPDGTNTLDHVLKKAPAAPQPPQPQAPPPADKPAAEPPEPAPAPQPAPPPAEKPDLPKLSGQFALQQARVTYVKNTGDPRTSHVAKLSADGTVNIPDLQTAPIDNKLDVQAVVDNRPAGTLAMAGKAAIAANGKLDLDAADVDQTVTLSAPALSAVKAFLPASAVRDLGGKLDGSIILKVAGGKTATISGSLTGSHVVAATPAFAPGEAFKAKQFAVVIPPTVVSAPQGLTHYETGTLKVGDGAKDQISVTADDLLAFSLSADAPVAALLAAAGNERPAAAGTVRQSFDASAVGLAKLMPLTMGLKPGVTIDGGKVEQSATLTTAAGKWQPRLVLRVQDLKGSAEAVDEKGVKSRKPIAIAPIGVEFKLDAYGGGWKTPDVRDLALGVRSDFLNGDVTAKTLADLNGKITGDLARAKQQLGQFVALDAYDVQGTVDLDASAKGDPAKPDAPTDLAVTASLRNLRLAGAAMGPKPVVEPLAQAGFKTRVVRNAAGDVIGLTRATVSAQVGEEAAPTVLFELVADEVKVVPATDAKKSNGRVDVPQFAITRGTIALPRVQAEFGPMLPLPPDLTIANGTVQITGGGSVLNDKTVAEVKAVVGDVGLVRTVALAASGPAAGVRQPVDVLKGYTLTADLAVAMATDPAGTATTTVSKLSVTDNQNLLKLAKTDAPLTVTTPKGGTAATAAALSFGADLGAINRIVKTTYATAAQIIASATGQSTDPTLTGGRVDGTLSMSAGADGATTVAVDADATGLTVAANTPNAVPMLKDEKLKLTVRAQAGAEFATLALQQMDAVGSFATAKATGQFQLKAGRGPAAAAVSPLAMVKKLNAVVSAPDFQKLQLILDAMPGAAKPTPAPVAYGTPTADTVSTAGGPVSLIPPASRGGLRASRDREGAGIARRTMHAAASKAGSAGAEPPLPDGRGSHRSVGNFEALSADGVPVILAAADKRAAVRAAAGAVPAPATPAPATPAAPAGTQPAAVPPAKLAGGSGTVTLDVTGDGTTLTSAADVLVRGVVLAVGTATHPVGDVTVKSRLSILSHLAPAAPAASTLAAGQAALAPSIMDQIAELRVSELNVAGLGTTVALKQPVVVKNLADLPALFGSTSSSATQPTTGGPAVAAAVAPPAGSSPPAGSAAKASLAGVLHVAGQLDPLMQVKAFLAGQPARADYGGAFSLDQALATDAGVIKIDGGGLVSDFVARDPAGKQTFAEKAIRLANTVALDTKGVGTLTISRLGLAFESSQALNFEANGTVTDFQKNRYIPGLLAMVSYDAEKLWTLVKPMMADPTVPPDKDPYKDLVVKGKATRAFTVGGYYPAVDAANKPVPFNVAVQQLSINGGLGLDWFSMDGLRVGKEAGAGQAAAAPGTLMPIEIPFSLVSGYLHTADLRKPPGQQTPAPIPCNGGTINLFGAYVNLTTEVPTLTLPKDLEVLDKVQLNSVLANALGEYLNHPLLVGADTEKGVLDVTVAECRDVPLGQAAKLRTPDNRGYAKMVMSFGGIQLGNPTLAGFVEKINAIAKSKANVKSLQGEIKNATVIYDRGMVAHDTTFALAEQGKTLRLYGDVNLATEQVSPMALLISPEWFGGEIARYVPKGLPLAFTGSYRAPKYDLGVAVQEAVKQNFLGGAAGGGKNPAEAVGNILNQFNQKKDKDADKKKPGTGGGAANDVAAPGPGGVAGNPPAAAATQPAAQPAAKPKDEGLGGLIGGLADQLAKDKEKKEKEKKEKERRAKEKRDQEKGVQPPQ